MARQDERVHGPDGLPDPALVVLVGAAGSGKSSWAAARYRSVEVVSSDALRGVVGSGPADLDASDDAFAVLDQVVAARVGRRLTTVVDTLGLDATRRRGLLDLARAHAVPTVLVLLDTPAAVCRERNARRDRPVPAAALARQLARVREAVAEVAAEGWDVVHVVEDAAVSAPDPAPVRTAERTADGPRLVLQLSRFPWGEDPAGWLVEVATAAEAAGLHGIALMDHLVQIPQVARAWDPIPEPYVTLGLLAGRSTSLHLGTLVSPMTFRSPGVVAKSVATLDVLTGGRAFCGVGAGWWEREHLGFGVPFPGPGERVDRLAAGIETMRALWSTGTKAYQGERVSLPETTSYPRPVGPVPVVVGGAGRRTLRVAAELGDASNVRTEVLDQALPVLRAHCAEVGRTLGEDVELTVLDTPVIGTDRDDVARRVERLRGRATAARFAEQHHAGTPRDQADRYLRLADHGVRTVFVALADLDTAADVERLTSIARALR